MAIKRFLSDFIMMDFLNFLKGTGKNIMADYNMFLVVLIKPPQ